MNLTTIASIGLVFALAAIPQLVIYYVTRDENTNIKPEYKHDYR